MANKQLQIDNSRAVKIAMFASSHCMAIWQSHELRLSWALGLNKERHCHGRNRSPFDCIDFRDNRIK